jgi:hypothetical protein
MNFTDQIAFFEANTNAKTKKLESFKYKDQRFMFSNKLLDKLIECNKDNYDIIKFGDKNYQSIRTLYFDTPKNKCYTDAHNKKRNRYDIYYHYCYESDTTYLEVKYLSKKGIEKKKKLKVDCIKTELNDEELLFLKKVMPGKLAKKLQARLSVNYKRITLIDKNRQHKVVLDTDIDYLYNDLKDKYLRLTYCKIRLVKDDEYCEFLESLKDFGVREEQINKYVLGMSIFGKRKSNYYKNRINKILRNYD